MFKRILIAGDGGQGVQTIAGIITQAAFDKGWQVSFIPNYGLEQRGGVSLAFIQISDTPVTYPKFSRADFLIVLSGQAKERTKNYAQEDTAEQFIFDEIKNLPQKNLNIFVLGWLAKKMKNKNILNTEDIFTVLEKKLQKKPNWEEIKAAFQMGLDY